MHDDYTSYSLSFYSQETRLPGVVHGLEKSDVPGDRMPADIQIVNFFKL